MTGEPELAAAEQFLRSFFAVADDASPWDDPTVVEHAITRWGSAWYGRHREAINRRQQAGEPIRGLGDHVSDERAKRK